MNQYVCDQCIFIFSQYQKKVTIDNDKVLVNSFDYFADDMQEQFSPIEDFIIDAACANTSQGCPTQPPIATPAPSSATTTTTPAPLPTTYVLCFVFVAYSINRFTT